METGEDGAGLVSVRSRYGVDESLRRLLELLATKGVTVFAVVDHSGEAAKVGMSMPPTKLVIFGSPKAGTPLMLAAPAIAIDLPLKMLIRESPEEDDGGGALLTYNGAEYLAERHGIPAELRGVLGGVAGLAKSLSD